MSTSRKDTGFLVYTAVLLLALFVGAKVYTAVYFTALDDVVVTTVEVTPELRWEVRENFETLSGPALAEKLKAATTSGKPVFLKMYASWCPHCRKTVPYFVDLKKQGYFDNAEVIFLAVDKKPEELVEYLAAHEYHKEFTPYVYRSEYEGDLRGVIQQYGLEFQGSIPYAALIDANGQLLAESLGDSVLTLSVAVQSLIPAAE